MPVCKKCDKTFPLRVVIDGRERILNSRSYCLECSPFGQRNTKKLHRKERDITCNTCGKKFDYQRGRNSHVKCNNCLQAQSWKKRKKSKKERLVEYKGGKCMQCGYNKYYQVLTFHHRDPLTKKFNISCNYCRRWEVLVEEADKCDLLCHNCHTELHVDERN